MERFMSFASRYRIVSIYQDPETDLGYDAKCLARKTPYFDLGRFSLEDENLKLLTEEVISLLEPSYFDDYYGGYVACLRSLNKKKFLQIYQNESLAQHQSFNWIEEENQQFKTWLTEPASKILLVSDSEGSGKRLVSQYLTREAEKHYKKSGINTISASFTFAFFDDRYNTLEALFTSLVLQLLLAEPTLFTFLDHVEARSISGMLSDDLNEPAVSRLWRLMKTLLSFRGRCAIVCAINAVQDCKSDYTTFLEDLLEFSSISEANFKIVITSVYDGTKLKIPLSIALHQEKVMELQVDKIVTDSVFKLIRTKHGLQEFEADIVKAIYRMIGPNFWQANLYIKYLDMSMTRTTPKFVRDTIISLGAEPAQSIISRLLHRLTDHDQDWSIRALAWIVYGFRPLQIPELATAMALGFVDPVSSVQTPVSLDCDPIDDWYSRDILGDMKLILGDIVEIHDTEIRIANLQLRQEIADEVGRRANIRSRTEKANNNISDSSIGAEEESSKASEPPKTINHLTIVQICLSYLSIERMERVYESLLSLDVQLESTIQPYSGPCQDNFCMYAAQYWPAHYLSIQGPTTEVVTTIIERFKSRCLDNIIPEITDFQAPVSLYCAGLGLRTALEVALEKEAEMIDDKSRDIILMAGTTSGNLETVKYLLAKFEYQQDSISKAIAGPLISGNQAAILELLQKFQSEKGLPVITSLLEKAAFLNGSPTLIQNAADQLKQQQSDWAIHLQPALHAAIQVGNKAVAAIILDLKSSGTEAIKTATDEGSQTYSPSNSLLHLVAANGNVALLSLLASENLPINGRDEKKRTALHLASMLSYQSMVRHLISKGIDVNAKDVVGRTALHYAALMGHLEIVKELLLQEGTKINKRDLARDTPLSLATKMRQGEVVKELLEKKASAKKHNKLEDTALHIAVRNGDETIVQLIASRENADLEVEDEDSFTPLHLAAQSGHLGILKLLIDRGAKINVCGGKGLTPLHLAAEKGHVALAKFLIHNGAEIDCLSDVNAQPLHLAAEAGHVALVKVLLEHNADVESKTGIDQTPLIFASAAGNLETVRCLVSHGAMPDQKDSNGHTALSVAARWGYRQIIDILLNAVASDDDLEWEQADLNKALQTAIRWNWLPIVKRLLVVGAEIKSKDRDGDSSLCNAMHAKSADMARFLLGLGAGVNHMNNRGLSALHLAIKNQLDECTKLLVVAGADMNISNNWVDPPLHLAASCGTLASFSILLDATEDVEFRSKVDNTTCIYAVCKGDESTSILGSEDTLERIKLLEAKGVNVKALGGQWGSPLHAAIAMRHKYSDAQSLDVVHCLLSLGASVTDEDEQGRSAVHIAASTRGSLDSFIKILGRDPYGLVRQDKQGRTVWHHAASGGNLQVLRYIARLDCSKNCAYGESSQIHEHSRITTAISQSDKHGWTPLMWSGKQSRHKVVAFLVDYGADVNHVSRNGWTADDVATYHAQKSVESRIRKAKAKQKMIELQGHTQGMPADDDDSRSSSDSDADDDSKRCSYSNKVDMQRVWDEIIWTDIEVRGPPRPSFLFQVFLGTTRNTSWADVRTIRTTL
ncbi:Ankyrin-3 [Trichoderma lentiforme]|uniref:Ankyrin-3 n=1 Tax=Trichoderma lentiforme TaxID=1567552 RepID=A0A9P5C8U3_9HYPO|nr:Ankyrin-3 [Trichoderma lentiforme]